MATTQLPTQRKRDTLVHPGLCALRPPRKRRTVLAEDVRQKIRAHADTTGMTISACVIAALVAFAASLPDPDEGVVAP